MSVSCFGSEVRLYHKSVVCSRNKDFSCRIDYHTFCQRSGAHIEVLLYIVCCGSGVRGPECPEAFLILQHLCSIAWCTAENGPRERTFLFKFVDITECVY